MMDYRRARADFSILAKTMKKYMKAHHHLFRVTPGGNVPLEFLRLEMKLIRSVSPLGPTPQTDLLLTGNAKKWSRGAAQILREHYTSVWKKCEAELKGLPKVFWKQALAVAVRWVRKDLRSVKAQTLRAASQNIQEIMTSTDRQEGMKNEKSKGVKEEERAVNINEAEAEEQPVKMGKGSPKRMKKRNQF
ncbi:uncharacterized protein LOC144016777 [Festucalex cinctus]